MSDQTAAPSVKAVQPNQPTPAVPVMLNTVPVNATVKTPLSQPAVQRNSKAASASRLIACIDAIPTKHDMNQITTKI